MSIPKSRADRQKSNHYSFEFGVLVTLGRYLWPDGQSEMKLRVVGSLVCLFLAKAASVYMPILFAKAVDTLTITYQNTVIVLPLLLIFSYGFVRILSIVFGELRDVIFAKVGQRAIRTIALRSFEHLHNLALRFHLERQTGGLSRSIERGTKSVDFILNFMLFNIIPTILEIILVCGILWGLFSFLYAFVTFVTITSYIVFTFIVTEWRLKYRRQMNETDNVANTRAIDSILNYETVKYFGNEKHEASLFDNALGKYENAAVLNKTTLSLLNIGQAFIIGIGLTLILWMAAGDVLNEKKMSIGDFVLVNAYLIQLYLPLNFLGYVYREIKQALIDMEKLFRLLTFKKEIINKPGAISLPNVIGTISFNNVSFAYDNRRQILKNVSFEVSAGTKTAIVGPSGAGKTTISRLLFRFYDVCDGSIEIDGYDIRDLQQESVRSAIGVVPQDTVLFNDTIGYNIEYGKPGASVLALEKAARQASIFEFINSTPDKFASLVGERGLKLSGGEKQRVAIARTILKDPRILIFDEATSALDTETEREIQEALSDLSSDRTTIIIAHRLSTIIDADEILVLDRGQIVERGTHKQLLAIGKIYAAMWKVQESSIR